MELIGRIMDFLFYTIYVRDAFKSMRTTFKMQFWRGDLKEYNNNDINNTSHDHSNNWHTLAHKYTQIYWADKING